MRPIYRFQLTIAEANSNLLNPNDTSFGFILEQTGGLIPHGPYKTTALIPVSPSTAYHLIDSNNTATNWHSIAAYSDSNAYLDFQSGGSSYTTPSGTKYVRITFNQDAELEMLSFCKSSESFEYYGKVIRRVFPLYRDDMAKNFNLEQGQQFFRASLSARLIFQLNDYAFIMARPFDMKFNLEMFISYDAGNVWASYWKGHFYKTDCEIDEDAEIITVSPSSSDDYGPVLAGIEKEYDLIKLTPSMVPIWAHKRPMIQSYMPGDNVVGCFLSGMYWEQECNIETNDTHLRNQYHFSKNTSQLVIRLTQRGSTPISPQIPEFFYGALPASITDTYEFTNGDYKLRHEYQSTVNVHIFRIYKISTSTQLWFGQLLTDPANYPITCDLGPVSGSGATGSLDLVARDKYVYLRYISDVASIGGVSTYALDPDNDIVPNNRNYTRVSPYTISGLVNFTDKLSNTPTQYGLYKDKYYAQPADEYVYGPYYPISRSAWDGLSIWFHFATMDWSYESEASAWFTIKNTYALASVISVLLKEFAPDITHEGTTEYSEFLYGNAVDGHNRHLFITPKSNIINANYDMPAQKAPITLKDVLEMLRDCFRCYWWIDDQKRFRIEHIEYFRNGGSYSEDNPTIGIDLTQQIETRNGKPWSFARSQYTFEKPEMAARYQFGWMDDVTQLFEGLPINIVSNYVQPGKIEEITISQFTSDIDYILLNPTVISKDGFVIMDASYWMPDDEYVLPIYSFVANGVNYRLQNGYMSFAYLQSLYAYDMPARNYEINGEEFVAIGTKKLKVQTLKFPALTDPNLMQLVKTKIGNGVFEKLSINLSSRTADATLKYDTE